MAVNSTVMNNGYVLSLTVAETGYDALSNTSNVTAVLNLICNGATFLAKRCMGEIKLGDTVVAEYNRLFYLYDQHGTTELCRFEGQVTHQETGSGTVVFTGSFDSTSAEDYMPGAGSVETTLPLTDIIRPSTLTGVSFPAGPEGEIRAYITKHNTGVTDECLITVDGETVLTVNEADFGHAMKISDSALIGLYRDHARDKSVAVTVKLRSYAGGTLIAEQERTYSEIPFYGTLYGKDGTWKSGIPYKRVAGVWMPCILYRNEDGFWRRGHA